MPIYTYKCNYCGDLYEPYLNPTSDHKAVLDTGNLVCHRSTCHGQYRRVFNANIRPNDGFGEGFVDGNTFVRSKRDLDELNKVKSEEATLRTGVEHKFRTVDLHDPAIKPPDVD